MHEQRMKLGLPQSSKQILDLIASAEGSRKFVWTAGRVVMKAGLRAQFRILEYDQRKLILERLSGFLEDLESQGTLRRRPIRQSIGYGQEIGYDYTPIRPEDFDSASCQAEPEATRKS
jgi:hypothetical protein